MPADFRCTFLNAVKKYSAFCIALTAAGTVFADSAPVGIIGGQGNAPYAALLQSDGSLVTVFGLPATGLTYRVAMNMFGQGIIGGTNGVNAYAALVSPGGILTPVPGLLVPGEIYTVAINEKGAGIIGGGHLATNIPYAALVSSKGAATTLADLPSTGLIYSVAIENSGSGIIGGIGPLASAYAALVSPTGIVTPIAGLPTTGSIFWVATNDSQMSFIGGQNNTSVYAAFIDSVGSVTPVAGLPLGLNYSVAINASGSAIMGGTSQSLPYAALVNPSGSVRTLTGLPSTAGIIYNVALNDSGAGLIAGFSASGPYGSFVAPDGSLTPLRNLPVGSGILDGAALHSSGIGLVGGSSQGVPFAALAAPDGTLTYLSGLPATGEINSTAFGILDHLVPKSIGPFDSWANTQFTMNDTLTQHCLFHHNNDESLGCFGTQEKTCSLWLSLFGNYVREKGHHAIPGFSNAISGALLGIDYNGIPEIVLGAGFAYAHNHVHYFKDIGHAEINQESGVIYATLNKPDFYVNAALWAGGFQSTNERRSLSFITSKANPSGVNISPHLECGTSIPISLCREFSVDPFISMDLAYNRQDHFREQGSSGFNIVLQNQSASILRTETGFRFFEAFRYGWGRLIMEEKISYINRSAVKKGTSTASFIGSVSSFGVETLNPCAQNQGSIQIHVECLPEITNNVYASLDYQGSFGFTIRSHMLTLSIGKDF